MIAEIVYVLCAVTSLTAVLLLLRAYLRSRVRLLLWTTIFFLGLTVNNVLIVLDLVLFPEVSLVAWRQMAAFISACLMLYGLIWDLEW